jgi:hypothetical protein
MSSSPESRNVRSVIILECVTLEVTALESSETSELIYPTTQQHIPEDVTFQYSD